MADILGIGKSGLLTYRTFLDTTGHNITNANVEGYSRQRTLTTTNPPELMGSYYVGNGVRVSGVDRIYNELLSGQIYSTSATTAELETYATYANRIDNMFGDLEVGLDAAIQDFFDAVQGVADDPASIPQRQLMLSEAEGLVERMHGLQTRVEDQQKLINSELASAVNDLNAIAGSLAEINEDIVIAQGLASGGSPNDLLDERDRLLKQLSELVSFTSFKQDDGSINVFIGKGQPLVIGFQPSTLGVTPDTTDFTKRDITISAGTGSQVITSQFYGGSIGGLLSFRDEILVAAQNQLGLVSVGLAMRVNEQHRLGLDLNGNLGGDLFLTPTVEVLADANNAGGAVTAAYVNASNLQPSDYELRYDGGNIYTLTRLSDATTTAINTGGVSPFTTVEIDGFTMDITAGAAVGDTFLVRPTYSVAGDIEVAITNLNNIAAAAPLRAKEATDANGLATNTGTGIISQPRISDLTNIPLSGVGGDITLTFNPNAGGVGIPGFDVTGGLVTTLLYDPATEGTGKQFSLPTRGGATFTLSGVPANGDSFVISDNTLATGDNRNALFLSDLQSATSLYNGSTSFQQAYGQLISDIGTKTRHADINYRAQSALLDQAIAARESVSGVNLDEEAANLMRYQQAYQASAQVIMVASTLFDTLLSAVQR